MKSQSERTKDDWRGILAVLIVFLLVWVLAFVECVERGRDSAPDVSSEQVAIE